MPEWPWDENREARRTRIAHLYRDTLWEAAPHVCFDLDATLDGYGQHWITGNYPPMDTNQPMTPTQIARWLDRSISSVTNQIAAYRIEPVTRTGARRGGKRFLLTQFTPNRITTV